MNNLICGLLVSVLLASAAAQAEVPRTKPPNSPTIAVQTEGTGATLEKAKRQAFKNAIQEAVGSVVVGEQETNNGRLTRDFAGDYSAGYVDSYELVDSYYDESSRTWHVTLMVWVASSKLPQRMLSEKNGTINADRANTQLSTQLEQREQGDRLLSLVLSNYPENAYILNSGQTEFKIGQTRQSYVDIPYTMTMNQNWVESFKEALSVVSLKNTECSRLKMLIADGVASSPTAGSAVKELATKVCTNDFDVQIFSKPKGNWFTQTDGYYFADLTTLHVINQAIQPPQGFQHVGVKIDLLDNNGGIIDTRCARIDNTRFVSWRDPAGTFNFNNIRRDSRPNIWGQNDVYGTFRINLKNQYQMQNLSLIKLSVQKTCY